MWFPYSLPTAWKVEGDRQRKNDSFADDQPREFLVAVQLRNPVLREWSVELQLPEPKSVLQKDEEGEVVYLSYFPDENERLAEVTCKLNDTNMNSAARRSYALVSKMLNFWSAEYGRGFSVGGLRVADLKHNARWRAIPHWPSALQLHTEIPTQLPEDFWPLASLYREGRTSGSDRYRFLCCETILEKWRRGDPPFDLESGGAKEQSTPPEALRVTQELMALSGMISFSPEIEGTPFEDLAERLKAWHLAALAFFQEGRAERKTEDLNRVFEWTAVANLVDLAAHQVLSRTIDRWRQADAEVERVESGSDAAGQVVVK